jgi:hypothetical protein
MQVFILYTCEYRKGARGVDVPEGYASGIITVLVLVELIASSAVIKRYLACGSPQHCSLVTS